MANRPLAELVLHQCFEAVLQRLQIARGTPLAIALSGGADSVALLALANSWAAGSLDSKGKAGDGTPILALVVDHKLRDGSAKEAAHACSVAEGLGVEAQLLRLEADNLWPPQNRRHLLAAARRARYERLVGECLGRGFTHLLTGHHADDQAENFIIRLSRGSGLAGLAGIPESSKVTLGGLEGVQLVRPLLAERKRDLEAFCRQEGLAWVEDPTNRDVSYVRNLIRACLSSASNLHYQSSWRLPPGETVASDGDLRAECANSEVEHLGQADEVTQDLLRLSRACADAESMLQSRATKLLHEMHQPGRASKQPATQHGVTVSLAAMRGQEQSVAIRALAMLLQGGRDFPPATDSLLRLWRLVKDGRLSKPGGGWPKHVSLGGCLLVPCPGTHGKLVRVVRTDS